LKNIFGIFWGLWSGLMYFIWAGLAAVASFFALQFGNEKSIYKAHWYPRYGCKTILFFSGMRYSLHNYKSIDEDAQYIFISNHVNMVDILFVRSIINNYLKILGKVELLKMPIMKLFAKHFAITVDRSNKKARKQSMADMNNQLQETNVSLLIYPEGTRNKTGDILQPFKKGAFIAAIENKIPIACITNVGLEKIMPKNKMRVYPGKIEAYIDVFETAQYTLEQVDELADLVRNRMLRYLTMEQ